MLYIKRDWQALGLSHWAIQNSVLKHSSEVLMDQYCRTETINPQAFSSLHRNAENHIRSCMFGVLTQLPKAIRDELRADIYELFDNRRMSYEEKYEWLQMLCIYLRDMEDLVWTQLGGF
jgi:hypothetical protein